MAFCTKCGVILHEEDIENHICAAEEVPQQGDPKKFQPKEE